MLKAHTLPVILQCQPKLASYTDSPSILFNTMSFTEGTAVKEDELRESIFHEGYCAEILWLDAKDIQSFLHPLTDS